MPRTVTARFETEAEAEQALSLVAAEVPLRDSAVVRGDVGGSLMLDTLHLTPEERSACDQQLSKGGFLLVAQVVSESRGEAVLRLLEGMERKAPAQAAGDAAPAQPRSDAVPAQPRSDPSPETPAPPIAAASPAASAPNLAPAPWNKVDEERIPIVEEELRIGKREVVRGRSRVQTYVSEVPVQEEVELFHEETQVDRRPMNRRLSEEEVQELGLLQERVIEITEMREEPVVTKEAFVREELVVTKTVHRRVEQIHDTVRRTEVNTERLEPQEGTAAPAG